MYTLKASIYEWLLIRELNHSGLHVTMRAVKINRKFMQASKKGVRYA